MRLLVLSCLILFGTIQASEIGFGVTYPRPHHSHHHHHGWPIIIDLVPRPHGHYETRIEHILVCPEHVEKRWVPIFETIIGRDGKIINIYKGVKYVEVVVPDRYEDKVILTWVKD